MYQKASLNLHTTTCTCLRNETNNSLYLGIMYTRIYCTFVSSKTSQFARNIQKSYRYIQAKS